MNHSVNLSKITTVLNLTVSELSEILGISRSEVYGIQIRDCHLPTLVGQKLSALDAIATALSAQAGGVNVKSLLHMKVNGTASLKDLVASGLPHDAMLQAVVKEAGKINAAYARYTTVPSVATPSEDWRSYLSIPH